MDNTRNIKEQVEETFKVLEKIEPVAAPPFFKHKTMQLMFTEKEEKQQPLWSWFTPKVQWVTFACILILNVLAFKQLNSTSSYNDNITEFAELYELNISEEETLNLNY